MIPAAIYMRVSTDKQEVENQRATLERMATARGWAPRWFEEVESGAKRRPVLEQVQEMARRGQIKALGIWALDRLGRSQIEMMLRVAELDRLGCAVVSVEEAWLDTTGPTRGLLVSIFGWVAEQERARIIARTREGLARARAAGVKLGRRGVDRVVVDLALEAVAKGLPLEKAAAIYGLKPPTLRRYAKAAGVLRVG